MSGSPSGAQSTSTQGVVDGNTAFALDLYRELKSTPGNLFFSPHSISTCLAMTCAGARGDTEKQMSRVLHLVQDQGKVHAAFGELRHRLAGASNVQGIELRVANSLWRQKGHPFLPAFLEIAREHYQANLNQTDFTTAAEAARIDINRWVAQETKEKIREILPPRSVDSLTRLVLANAIYFKGTWVMPFDEAETSTQPFHLSAERHTNVPLMHHYDEVRYLENSDFQAAELPYRAGRLSMVIMLPRRWDGCGDLENRLSPALLADSLKGMKSQRVEIFLPRFTLESSFDLKEVLATVGMPDAFGLKADFSGIDGGTDPLYISGVFHKAWGEVNEEGTEAAAATVFMTRCFGISKPPPPPPVFRADHPFVFFIRDTRTGSILFLGRLSEPSP